ncbi:MAG: DUF2799 domain-containing protein [Pseudomonadota bacterium]
MKHIFFAACTAVAMTGCASGPSYTAEQCSAMDWYGLGVQDGRNGQPMTALNDEIMGCREFGVEADLDAYRSGRDQGLTAYCVAPVLLDASVQGVGDPFVCEPFSEELRLAFETGRDTRTAVQRWQGLKQQYDQLIAQRDQINAEGSQLSERYRQTADEATRAQIAARLDYLRQQLSAVEAQIDEASPIVAREEAEYQSAVATYERVKAGFGN